MKLDLSIFNGDTINTPSLLVIEDYIESLNWAQAKGGLDYLISKSNENLKVIEKYVEKNADWIQFLVDNKSIRSNTSVCLIFDKLNKFQVKSLINLLENECVAYDISSYRDAPYGIFYLSLLYNLFSSLILTSQSIFHLNISQESAFGVDQLLKKMISYFYYHGSSGHIN